MGQILGYAPNEDHFNELGVLIDISGDHLVQEEEFVSALETWLSQLQGGKSGKRKQSDGPLSPAVRRKVHVGIKQFFEHLDVRKNLCGMEFIKKRVLRLEVDEPLSSCWRSGLKQWDQASKNAMLDQMAAYADRDTVWSVGHERLPYATLTTPLYYPDPPPERRLASPPKVEAECDDPRIGPVRDLRCAWYSQ